MSEEKTLTEMVKRERQRLTPADVRLARTALKTHSTNDAVKMLQNMKKWSFIRALAAVQAAYTSTD